MHTPTLQYLLNEEENRSYSVKGGGIRRLSLKKRNGINATSIHTRIVLPKHNLNDDCGTLTLWFYSLEDLATMSQLTSFSMSNKFFQNYTFLSDNEKLQDFENSVFSINWDNCWYPQFYFKFYKGKVYPDGYNPEAKAIVTAGHFHIHKDTWYQLSITWNKPQSKYKLYMNGILIATSDSFATNLVNEKVNEILYAGNPCFCISDIKFYNEVLKEEELTELFKHESSCIDEDIQAPIRQTFKGEGVEEFKWKLDDSWKNKLDMSLMEEEHLKHFYVQGCLEAPSVTAEGLLVTTPQNIPKHGSVKEDLDQVYLWSDRTFEGDLYVEYEFKSLKERGLSLLMVQASGMQREDFMADYPLRTNGSMITVFGEDVRNYHWEYYREMNDVRNDVASHALLKNPWGNPIGYRCMTEPIDRSTWHKVQFLQEGAHLRCIMDGMVVIDCVDNAFSNSGPVLNFGRIAIRCMVRTKVIFRNLKVFNK